MELLRHHRRGYERLLDVVKAAGMHHPELAFDPLGFGLFVDLDPGIEPVEEKRASNPHDRRNDVNHADGKVEPFRDESRAHESSDDVAGRGLGRQIRREACHEQPGGFTSGSCAKITTAFAAVSILVASLMACGGNDNNPPPNAPMPTGTSEMPADASAPGFTNPAPFGDGGTGSSATDKPGMTNPPPADTSAATPKFDDLPKDKKIEIMMTKVVPNVGKDFKDYDGKRYAKFGCATCHGPQKNQDPHAVLPKLTLSNGGFEKLAKAKPEIVKFMSEKVTPDMASRHGRPALRPEDPPGLRLRRLPRSEVITR